MKPLVTFLVTALMAAHAALGCCSHHEHQTVEKETVACAKHQCHAHHGHHDSDAPSDHEPSHECCDDEACIYVAQKNVSQGTFDFAFVVPLYVANEFLNSLHAEAVLGHAARENSLHPAGPALHLWQCVIVV